MKKNFSEEIFYSTNWKHLLLQLLFEKQCQSFCKTQWIHDIKMVNKNNSPNTWACCLTPVISASEKPRQKDHGEFKPPRTKSDAISIVNTNNSKDKMAPFPKLKQQLILRPCVRKSADILVASLMTISVYKCKL